MLEKAKGTSRAIRTATEWYRRNANELEQDRRNYLEQLGLPPDHDSETGIGSEFHFQDWQLAISKASELLKHAGFHDEAGQLWTFWEQIEQRDELTKQSDFDLEELSEWVEDAIGQRGTNVKTYRASDSSSPADNPESAESNDADQPPSDYIKVELSGSRVWFRDTWYEVSADAALLLHACVKSHPRNVFASDIEGEIRPARVKQSLPRQLKAIFRSARGQGCWLEY